MQRKSSAGIVFACRRTGADRNFPLTGSTAFASMALRTRKARIVPPQPFSFDPT